ncbi:hypothetical protein [Oceanithermus sp.]|uniref:hypothetical protein n=1 Tax=Oceanithermus sp. TaxID=2268145 RepID=UPI0025D119AB|nr:hypothetical protein [Oceanithermus sp.]
MAARVAATFGHDIEAVIWDMPGEAALELERQSRRLDYERALPVLLSGYQNMLAHWPPDRGSPPDFGEYVPESLRPDPLEGWDVSADTWADIGQAVAEGVGTEELARLRGIFGPEVIGEVVRRYG